MTVFDAIRRELDDARETGFKEVVHIRVTTDGLPGAVVSVPVTPERARVLGKLLMQEGRSGVPLGVVADGIALARMMEILIHPEDYATLLKGFEAQTGEVHFGKVTAVLGIPVSQ